jgi:hypothetical protein
VTLKIERVIENGLLVVRHNYCCPLARFAHWNWMANERWMPLHHQWRTPEANEKDKCRSRMRTWRTANVEDTRIPIFAYSKYSVCAKSNEGSSMTNKRHSILQDKMRQLCIYVYSLRLDHASEQKKGAPSRSTKSYFWEIRCWLSSTANPSNTPHHYHPSQNPTHRLPTHQSRPPTRAPCLCNNPTRAGQSTKITINIPFSQIPS